jgi:hypothetical protein
MSDRTAVDAAFHDFITGTGTQRTRLLLLLDGRDVTGAFIEALAAHRFVPTTVDAVDIQPGERVPAFYLADSTAYFGWVFHEKFTDTKMRKLWGSVVRNAKGDWAIQISPTKTATVYANSLLKSEFDIDHPV